MELSVPGAIGGRYPAEHWKIFNQPLAGPEYHHEFPESPVRNV
jgi:hypothetical protein